MSVDKLLFRYEFLNEDEPSVEHRDRILEGIGRDLYDETSLRATACGTHVSGVLIDMVRWMRSNIMYSGDSCSGRQLQKHRP
jgi:hypothetical protein